MAKETATAQMGTTPVVNQTAASANSVNGAATQAASAEVKTSSRRRKNDPMQAINTMVLRKFKNLPSDMQTCETKRSCINAVLASHKEKCGDAARYYGWILYQASLVKRTFDFKSGCEQKGLTSEEEQQAVAEHLVIDGKAVCNNIRLNGLASFTGNIRMYRERLVPVEYRFDAPVDGDGKKEEGADE